MPIATDAIYSSLRNEPWYHNHTSPSMCAHSMFASHTELALKQLGLCHILNGETCPPISFAHFASFLTNNDYTSENLVFVLWYRDYKSKWKLLDKAVRIRVPVPSTSLGHRHDPFGYLRHGPELYLPGLVNEKRE